MDIKTTGYVYQPNTTLVSRFTRALEVLIDVLPLTKLELKPDPLTPLKWNYKLITADGRKWNETFRRDSDKIWHEFDLDGEFLKQEYGPHRIVRDILEEFILLNVDSIKVDF